LPKLKALAKKDTAMPIVRYYEGKESVWDIPEDLAKYDKELFKVFKFMFDSLWRELEGKNLPDLEQIKEARQADKISGK